MDLKKICTQVIDITKKTGRYIGNERMSFTVDMVETKGLHDFVSHVDKDAENMLVGELAKIVPEAGFIAEEGTGKKNSGGLNWIIDPLDGTTNFIHGLPPYSVSIALVDDTKVLLGVIYEIILDECFYSWEGAPAAWLNEKEIKVSAAGFVKDSLIATGFPSIDFDRMTPFLASFEYFMKNSHGLRRLGSAAADLAYVACGRVDAFYEYGLSPWDVAAGAFIVQQAGGKVCDFNGENDYLFGGELVASNSQIYDEFRAAIYKFMVDK